MLAWFLFTLLCALTAHNLCRDVTNALNIHSTEVFSSSELQAVAGRNKVSVCA